MNSKLLCDQLDCAKRSAIILSSAEKIFSGPRVCIDTILDLRHAEMNKIARKRNLVFNKNRANPEDRQIQPQQYPVFCVTPLPETSNVGTSLVVRSYNALGPMDPTTGTHDDVIGAMLEYICDYANKFQSQFLGEDHNSKAKDPIFYCLSSNFCQRLDDSGTESMNIRVSKRFTARQFWLLRYLFIPIQYSLQPASQLGHVALCVISPEGKTVDFLCSAGDSGLANGPSGEAMISKVLHWLASFLSHEPSFQLNPVEWRMRTDASDLQKIQGEDCAQYIITNAMFLAFGYGINYHGSTFVEDHQNRMEARRRRIAQDLMYGGFKPYNNAGEAADNEQYYPILNTPPTARAEDGWLPLDSSIVQSLAMRESQQNLY